MSNIELKLIPVGEFERIGSSSIEEYAKLALIADMCRANALMSVKKAGSGHLGSRFSAMDIAVFLYYKEMNTIELGLDHPDRDIYFSSKGHHKMHVILNSWNGKNDRFLSVQKGKKFPLDIGFYPVAAVKKNIRLQSRRFHNSKKRWSLKELEQNADLKSD